MKKSITAMAILFISSIMFSFANAGDHYSGELSGLAGADQQAQHVGKMIEKLNSIILKEKDEDIKKDLFEVTNDLEKTRMTIENLKKLMKAYLVKNNKLSKHYDEMIKRYAKCNACNGLGNLYGRSCKICGGDGILSVSNEIEFSKICDKCEGTGILHDDKNAGEASCESCGHREHRGHEK